jgi:N-acetylmuramoyl-L-alanine amidase
VLGFHLTLRILEVTAADSLLVRGYLLFFLIWLVSADIEAGPAVVVIDPGHGGFDRGGMPGQVLPEKPYTLDVAKRLAQILRGDGRIKVVLTRTADYYVSLPERTRIANAYAGYNAVFVSIHFNSGWRRGAYGIETYYYNSRAYRLAALIHPRVIQALGSIDRRIRRRGYFVLRRNRLPAVLVECGFLTNPAEAARILTPAVRENIARAIAAGIERY